jgi:hypothetical protein
LRTSIERDEEESGRVGHAEKMYSRQQQIKAIAYFPPPIQRERREAERGRVRGEGKGDGVGEKERARGRERGGRKRGSER